MSHERLVVDSHYDCGCVVGREVNSGAAFHINCEQHKNQRPKGGIEQARRNLMRDDPELYQYIEARIAARELKRAGGDASGAVDGYGAANRVWRESGRWEQKWRKILEQEKENEDK